MSQLAQYHAVAKQGDILWHHERGLRDFLRAHDGKAFRVVFHEPKRQRSGKQNNWYHQIIEQIMESTGEFGQEAHDRIHEVLKAKYLGYEEVEIMGQVLRRPRSTKSLSTKEFAAYCENIRIDAASGEFGHVIVIPDPE